MEEYGNNASSSEHYVYREPVKAPINPPYKSALGSQAANPKWGSRILNYTTYNIQQGHAPLVSSASYQVDLELL